MATKATLPTNSFGTYLVVKGTYATNAWTLNGSTYSKVCDIKSFPDLGGKPEKLPSTTLSNGMGTGVNGIEDVGELNFTANYTLDDYKKLDALEGKEATFGVWFAHEGMTEISPENAVDGRFEWNGVLHCFVTGKGVNEVKEISIIISNQTEIKLVED